MQLSTFLLLVLTTLTCELRARQYSILRGFSEIVLEEKSVTLDLRDFVHKSVKVGNHIIEFLTRLSNGSSVVLNQALRLLTRPDCGTVQFIHDKGGLLRF